jgi:hypothetical protein
MSAIADGAKETLRGRVPLVWLSRGLDVLTLGEDTAQSLGVSLRAFNAGIPAQQDFEH